METEKESQKGAPFQWWQVRLHYWTFESGELADIAERAVRRPIPPGPLPTGISQRALACPDVATYLCEMTPSLTFHILDYQVEWTPEDYEQVSEDLRDWWYNWLDSKESGLDDAERVVYYHRSSVWDRDKKEWIKGRAVLAWGDKQECPAEDMNERCDPPEDVLEHAQGNWYV